MFIFFQKSRSHKGPIKLLHNKPYITRRILKATKEVPIKRAGLSAYSLHNLPLKVPCFFFSSIESLLADTKAISIPEKNPINNKEIKIAKSAVNSMTRI